MNQDHLDSQGRKCFMERSV